VPIRIVLNGFFRSGTTLLWDWFRRALPDALCFYEPLHPDLERLARDELRTAEPHADHGLLLWEEYNRLPEGARAALLRDHPGRLGRDWHDESDLFRYLDRFHELPGEVVLQPCRASGFLSGIASRYGARTVHMVRRPLAVLDSMIKSASGSRYSLKRMLVPLLWRSRLVRGYDLQETSDWIRSREPGVERPHPSGILEQHLFVWTHSNHWAVEAIGSTNGTMIAYEELLADPKGVRARLERDLERDLPADPPLRPARSIVVSDRDVRNAARAVTRLGLEERFEAVCAAVESLTGQDYLDSRTLR
jgi:hypothetical protein